MGRVFISGIVPQKVAPITFKSNFADNDWSTIIKACQTNKVPDTWTVGSQKTMTINGTDYAIDIIGKNHDTYSDGSGKAPLTFQMHDLYGTTYKMNNFRTNSGGWTSCIMRSTSLPAILALMPSEVQNAIKEVNKLTSAGTRSTTINTTADKLFLLSDIEVFGKANYSVSGEGTQYAYYAAGNSAVKNINGTVTQWWLRSPNSGDNYYFCHIKTDGSYDANAANEPKGVSFAFCF